MGSRIFERVLRLVVCYSNCLSPSQAGCLTSLQFFPQLSTLAFDGELHDRVCVSHTREQTLALFSSYVRLFIIESAIILLRQYS